MKAKEYLKQPFEMMKAIKIKEQKLKYYRELSTNVSAVGFEEKYNATKNTEAPFVRYIEKISILEQELAEDRKKLEQLKFEVDKIIDALEDLNEEMVLRYRYVNLMQFEEIAQKLYVSISTIYRWHSIALKNLKK